MERFKIGQFANHPNSDEFHREPWPCINEFRFKIASTEEFRPKGLGDILNRNTGSALQKLSDIQNHIHKSGLRSSYRYYVIKISIPGNAIKPSDYIYNNNYSEDSRTYRIVHDQFSLHDGGIMYFHNCKPNKSNLLCISCMDNMRKKYILFQNNIIDSIKSEYGIMAFGLCLRVIYHYIVEKIIDKDGDTRSITIVNEYKSIENIMTQIERSI